MSSETLANTKPVITKHSSEFKLDAYASIPTGELVVLAVSILQADDTPAAVEEIVSTCFRLFPHSFALKNYFYWPDSALVARRLHDAKEKGLLKGSPTEGYESKGKGRQVAKQTAKTLGVSLPVPPKKVEVPAPVAPKVEIETPVKPVEMVEAPVIPLEKVKEAKPKPKSTVKVVRKAKAVRKEDKKKETTKVKTPAKKKVVTQPKVEPKKATKPAAKLKTQPKSKPAPKAKSKVIKPQVKPAIKATPKATKKKVEAQARVKTVVVKEKPKAQKAQSAKPTQLTLGLTPPAAWQKTESPATKPKLKQEAPPSRDKKPVKKVEVVAAVVVSKEEKDKAAKVIKQLERSDAYQLYRRNGRRAQIGEFDFRNMLFATMESSAETLKRNVDLFKRYAGMHFRTDLIAFLEFCEEHFAGLLKTKAKLKR